MEENELPVELYDFLYKDAERIASYYAQLFQGKLLSTERTTSDKATKDRSGKLNTGVLAGDVRSTEETQETFKQVLDPHDTAVNDVLAYFRENGFLLEDVENAPPGSLILAKGVLNFADGIMLRAVISNLTSLPPTMMGIDDNPDSTVLLALVGSMFSELSLPSVFLLETQDTTITGTLKSSGLQEPVSSYYFKQGSSGLADVYLIGIKDHIVPAGLSARSDLFGATQQIAEGLSNMILPQDALRVLPLAMFRILRSPN